MTNYIELIFIENLIMNYVIIKQVSIFTKIKLNSLNNIICILVLTIYSTITNLLSLNCILLNSIKVLAIVVSIYISFKPNSLKIYFKIFIYYITISFMLVGVVISLTLIFRIDLQNYILKMITYAISGLITYLFNKYLWKMWKTKIKKDNLVYTISVKNISIPAFVDTGNSVYDYQNNLDVVFVEDKYYETLFNLNLLNEKLKLSINTITSKNECTGYILKNVKIKQNQNEIFEFKKIIFVFVNKTLSLEGVYNALIGYETYIDKLMGVEL